MSHYVTAATQARTPAWVHLVRALVVLLLVAVVGGAAWLTFAPLPAVASDERTLDAPPAGEAQIAWPGYGAAAFAIDGVEGAAGTTGDAAVPMASITKLATVLVVLDAHPIDADEGAEITLDDEDVAFMQAAFDDAAPYYPVRAGQVVTQADLVDASVVASSANAAMTLARWGFGSIDGFVAAAADWAQANGLPTMVVADAAGLSLESVASPADMVRLGQLAMAEPLVAEAMGASSVQVPGLGVQPNTNGLLGEAGIDAGKTGALFVSGRNLLVSATAVVEGRELRAVAVVLGQVTEDDRDAATIALVESLWQNVQQREVVAAGAVVATSTSAWGATSEATTEEALSTLAWVTQPIAVEVDVEPVSTGVGSMEVGSAAIPGSELATTVVAPRIPEPDLLWRLTNPLVLLGLAEG
ncbi:MULTISPECIES: D-alanyl-D-alanine carboxypeptidase family protein [unclassified Agrococcus]|uniref:D-alanyl-D-alanine carboxypeptidase family protein n=1 Tax=unclassified Agrococcus TaxID=2615065 RepID=UPI00362313A3